MHCVWNTRTQVSPEFITRPINNLDGASRPAIRLKGDIVMRRRWG